ncbi:Uncharacterized protein TCM_030777 [Theobroma cacao]|uniref:TF-B3 domain-containing protein n=1 Tax=Theobroma cacao TaxID=3641 RepID=A0A061F5R9_THECC|nr:Uncharacterized protein TCM_030777 [Theobroma cacao]
MKLVLEKIISTRKDKEKLRISSKDGNLDLLPKGSGELRVQSENGELDLELIQVDGDSRIIRGKGWRDFIGNYHLGATLTIYIDDDGKYKIQVRNQ